MKRYLINSALALAMGCASLHATVSITSIIPSLSSPQPVGTPVSFAVSATDSNAGPLTFQFSVSYGGAAFAVLRNFNIGVKTAGVWNPQPISWATLHGEGVYTIQVTVKDFKTGEKSSMSIPYQLTTLITNSGKIIVVPTQHPLVALAAVPACATGNFVRAYFIQAGTTAATETTFQPCGGTLSSNFYIGGLQVNQSYAIGYQIWNGSTLVTGPSQAKFQSGSLPANVSFPTQTLITPPGPQGDSADGVLLHAYLNTATVGQNYQPTATDQFGNVIWYYPSTDLLQLMTRPLPGGTFLMFQTALSWDANTETTFQVVRQVDLAGNVLKETNIGLLQQQLHALGSSDLQSCKNISLPAAVGSACITSLSHDAILLPNGYYAFVGTIEKIFPPGTQGNTTGLNVDILGDAIIVIDKNLNAVWYDDLFQHDGGGNQLDINRPATLGETCAQAQGGCPPLFLAGTANVTTTANDWLHSNSLVFRASDGNFMLSSRHQDWVMLFDYSNGTGTGNILWRLGLAGDFTFNNVNNDPYPWFSHQHDAGFEVDGEFTVFDNGNKRIAVEGGGNSRGMGLTLDEIALIATPVISQDLGYYGFALGSAQLLSNGNYHFQPGYVAPNNTDYSLELLPTPGTTAGTTIYNLEGSVTSYRSFRMPNMYNPPLN